MSKKALPFGTMFLVLVIALSVMGVGYALWSETLTIQGNVQTGEVDVAIADATVAECVDVNGVLTCPEPAAKADAANCTIAYGGSTEQGDDGASLLKVTVTGMYPSYHCKVDFKVKSLGNVPVHVWLPEAVGTIPEWVSTNFENCYADGTQLHQNQSTNACTMDLHFTNDTAPLENSGPYTFSWNILATQWNEDPSAPIYDAIPAVYPGSFPSLGYEATSTDEFGDHISFAGTARALTTVDVSLTDWACENDGTRAQNEACISTPGSFFTHPITLNLYTVDHTGGNPAVGALLGSVTQTFNIPYRPSWDSTMCTGAGETPATDLPFGGKWYDPVGAKCVHGSAFNITFDFSSLNLTLPDEVIYGVAYNTQHYGVSPTGLPGPYDSLNVSLAQVPPAGGTDVEPGTTFWDTSHGPFYCDGGVGGTDTFRRDSGCWDTYTPVVRFNAGN